jgi:hypothetical protein
MSNEQTRTIASLWASRDAAPWESALGRYWEFVKEKNRPLEERLMELRPNDLSAMTPEEWFRFLHDEYFRWKYTAPNRYATTTKHLRTYREEGRLDDLDGVRQRLLRLDPSDTRGGIGLVSRIRGLGVAGASGLLALLYPEHFGTVDQFVVKALRTVPGLPEADALRRMNPDSLTVDDAVILLGIMRRKAEENNLAFGGGWTPRKIDMVLWTYGRR